MLIWIIIINYRYFINIQSSESDEDLKENYYKLNLINVINKYLWSSKLLPTTLYSRKLFRSKDDKVAVISAKRLTVWNERQTNL